MLVSSRTTKSSVSFGNLRREPGTGPNSPQVFAGHARSMIILCPAALGPISQLFGNVSKQLASPAPWSGFTLIRNPQPGDNYNKKVSGSVTFIWQRNGGRKQARICWWRWMLQWNCAFDAMLLVKHKDISIINTNPAVIFLQPRH